MPDMRRIILEWGEAGRLQPGDVPRALDVAGVLPQAAAWRTFISALLLWLGALLFAAGVIFFLAYNWQELHRYAKFGLVETLFVAALLVAAVAGVEKTTGKAALLAAALLTGALLALFGQTYQTGADPYELFAIWALFVVPWVLIARLPALWLMWVGLLNLAVVLYFEAFSGVLGILFGKDKQVWALFTLNTVALVAWEFGIHRGIPWLQARWAVRVLAAASGALATVLVLWSIFDVRHVGPLGALAYLGWCAAAYRYYRHRQPDLFVLAGGVLSVVIVVAAFLARHLLRHGDAGAFLLIGLVVIGLSAAGAWWLKTVAGESK